MVKAPLLGLLWVSVTVHGLYYCNFVVEDLSESNFDSLVTHSDNVWVVEFFLSRCLRCQMRSSEDFLEAAKALKGVVRVGAVNAEIDKSLAERFGVTIYPKIKIFGSDKNKPEGYNGDRSAKSLVEAVLFTVKSKVYAQMDEKDGGSSSSSYGLRDVVELSDSNFNKTVLQSEEMWLVNFHAFWCKYSQIMEPQWVQAAAELRGKVKFGSLDATVSTIASRYDKEGYPVVVLFHPGKKSFFTFEEYEGNRTAKEIVKWSLEKLAEHGPAPKVSEIVDDVKFRKACEEHPLCVISVLPHIRDCQATCRNIFLDIINDVGREYKNSKWGWVWSEAGSQAELERALGIGEFGYPAMVVLNAERMKYSIFYGSFSLEGIDEFLRGVESFGRVSTYLVKGLSLPKIAKTQPWDGKDRKTTEYEDEAQY